MKRNFIIVVFALVSNIASSQEVDCNELLEFIVENGYKKATLPNYILNSSWLYEVTAYSHEYKTFVVVEIKKNEYSSDTKTYIFCGIPELNWQNFQYGSYGDPTSYGERFHKYIIDYECNCE